MAVDRHQPEQEQEQEQQPNDGEVFSADGTLIPSDQSDDDYSHKSNTRTSFGSKYRRTRRAIMQAVTPGMSKA